MENQKPSSPPPFRPTMPEKPAVIAPPAIQQAPVMLDLRGDSKRIMAAIITQSLITKIPRQLDTEDMEAVTTAAVGLTEMLLKKLEK